MSTPDPAEDQPPLRDHRGEWWTSLRRLRAHTAAHGYPKQRDRADDGWRPGKWVAKQKDRWDTLDPDQQEALAATPGFARDAREAHFDQMAHACRRALDAGTLLSKEATYDGLPVGQWFTDLRRSRTTLTDARVEKLRSLGLL